MVKSVEKKIRASVLSGALFILVSLPYTYYYTNTALQGFTGSLVTTDNCPNFLGKFIHTFVFFLLNFLVMKIGNSKKSADTRKPDSLLWKYSFYGSLLYYLIADSDAYKLTDKLFGLVGFELADSSGCPNLTGIFIHAAVFILAVFGVMHFPKDM